MSSTDAIAKSFLKALDAPDTPAMRAAVKAWLTAEGISSVKRNNPWNLHHGAPCLSSSHYCPISKGAGLPGQIGVQYVGSGDQNVAVFDTLDHGVQANANNLIRLRNSGYGYDLVIRQARAGDPAGFLNALALSSWSEGRYGTKNGGANKLIGIYNSLTGAKLSPFGYKLLPGYTPPSGIPGGGGSGSPIGGGTSPGYLGGGNLVGGGGDGGSGLPGNPLSRALAAYMKANKIDPTTKITADQFWAAVSKLPGMTPDNGEAQQIAANFIGQPWGSATALATDINKPHPSTDPLTAIANFVGLLADPSHWARILALLAGAGLAVFGGVNLYRATA